MVQWTVPNQDIRSSPNPIENVIIARAQSILTTKGKLGPVLCVEEAMDVLIWAGAWNYEEPVKFI